MKILPMPVVSFSSTNFLSSRNEKKNQNNKETDTSNVFFLQTAKYITHTFFPFLIFFYWNKHTSDQHGGKIRRDCTSSCLKSFICTEQIRITPNAWKGVGVTLNTWTGVGVLFFFKKKTLCPWDSNCLKKKNA